MKTDKIIFICDKIIEGGILAIVFFTPLIIDFFAITYNPVDIYKAVFFRCVLLAVLLAYALKIFIAGKINYRGPGRIFAFVLLLLASFFASSLFSIHPNQSFWGDFFRQQGFYNYVHYLLFFVLLVLNIKNFKQVKRIIMAVIMASSLTAIYGLIQYFNLDPIAWTEKAASTGRVFSTLGQPNWYGHYLVLVLPISLYALFFMAKSFLARFFLGISALLQLVSLLFTQSRAAWLGFLGALAFLVLAWLILKRHKKAAFSLIVLLISGLIAIAGLNIIKPANINHNTINLADRVRGIVDFRSGSNKMRLYYLKAGLEEISRATPLRLILGSGPETLESVFMKYYEPEWGVHEAINGAPDKAHNWLFDQILAIGFLGFAATLAFYSYFIYQATVRLFSKEKFASADWLAIFLFLSLVAYFINNLFSFSLLTNLIYLHLLLGLAWLMINFREQERTINIRLTVFSKTLIWSALLAVAGVFIYTNNINQVKAEINYLNALKAMHNNDCDQAIKRIRTVMDLNPNSNYYQENFFLAAANCFPLASGNGARQEIYKITLEEIELIKDKEYPGLLLNLARFYSLAGSYINQSYYNRAEEIFVKLIKSYPGLTLPYEDLGRQKMWQNDYEGAIRLFEQANRLLPALDHPDLNPGHRDKIKAVAVQLYELTGQSYLKLKKYDLAAAYFRKGISLNPYRATLYKGIADSYYLQGRLDQAISINKRGLMLNVSDYYWPFSLSLLYRDKKDLGQAKKYLDQALKLAPEREELKKYYEELNNKNNQ